MVISGEETKQPDIIFTNISPVIADPTHYTSMSESSSEPPYAEKTNQHSQLY